MTNLSKITQDALNSYFKTLRYKGYLNKSEIHKILILSFIEEIIDDKFFEYITESDYNTMINAIYRMVPNSSIIKFPSYDVYTDLVQDIRTYNKFRASEDNNIRLSKGGIVRVDI